MKQVYPSHLWVRESLIAQGYLNITFSIKGTVSQNQAA